MIIPCHLYWGVLHSMNVGQVFLKLWVFLDEKFCEISNSAGSCKIWNSIFCNILVWLFDVIVFENDIFNLNSRFSKFQIRRTPCSCETMTWLVKHCHSTCSTESAHAWYSGLSFYMALHILNQSSIWPTLHVHIYILTYIVWGEAFFIIYN